MNNELGRKITSLTLMTIMLAGGMVIAAPGIMPAAHAANANLFVSAENSQFDNYMSGPQVIEVVVIDSDINDTDEAKGEPDVTVNGKILRMIQAVDGNWYGYFADRTQASIADSIGADENAPLSEGLDFGTLCTAASGNAAIEIRRPRANARGPITETSAISLSERQAIQSTIPLIRWPRPPEPSLPRRLLARSPHPECGIRCEAGSHNRATNSGRGLPGKGGPGE